jgi:hypothetical protein
VTAWHEHVTGMFWQIFAKENRRWKELKHVDFSFLKLSLYIKGF